MLGHWLGGHRGLVSPAPGYDLFYLRFLSLLGCCSWFYLCRVVLCRIRYGVTGPVCGVLLLREGALRRGLVCHPQVTVCFLRFGRCWG